MVHHTGHPGQSEASESHGNRTVAGPGAGSSDSRIPSLPAFPEQVIADNSRAPEDTTPGTWKAQTIQQVWGPHFAFISWSLKTWSKQFIYKFTHIENEV